jgi:hypothetical protein
MGKVIEDTGRQQTNHNQLTQSIDSDDKFARQI